MYAAINRNEHTAVLSYGREPYSGRICRGIYTRQGKRAWITLAVDPTVRIQPRFPIDVDTSSDELLLRRNIGERTAIVIFVLCTLNGERGGGRIIMVHTYICVRFQCDLNMYVVYLICLVSRDRKKIIVIILCTFGCDLKMWSKICWCVWFCDRGGKNIYIYLKDVEKDMLRI